MKEKIAKLIEVKKIIALLFSITFVAMAFMGMITNEQFIPLITMVIGYYFGQSTAKGTKGTN